VLIIYAIQVNVYFDPNTTTTIIQGTYAAYTAGVVCVFNETVSNRLYTVKRLGTMNNWKLNGLKACLTGGQKTPPVILM